MFRWVVFPTFFCDVWFSRLCTFYPNVRSWLVFFMVGQLLVLAVSDAELDSFERRACSTFSSSNCTSTGPTASTTWYACVSRFWICVGLLVLDCELRSHQVSDGTYDVLGTLCRCTPNVWFPCFQRRDGRDVFPFHSTGFPSLSSRLIGWRMGIDRTVLPEGKGSTTPTTHLQLEVEWNDRIPRIIGRGMDVST